MELAVQKRESFGKNLKALRRGGLIPGEFYGHGMENLHLSVPKKDFQKVFDEAGENTVVYLVVGSEKKPAIIQEVGRHYLTGEVTHVDFYGVRMDEKISAPIPLEFVGEAPGVKEKGGVLNKNLSEIEVEAFPGDLPHAIQVDLSVLQEIDQSIYVKDLLISDKVEVLIDPETPVATLTPPRAEEIAPVAPVDVSEIKVETEEKKAERAEEKAAEGEIKE